LHLTGVFVCWQNYAQHHDAASQEYSGSGFLFFVPAREQTCILGGPPGLLSRPFFLLNEQTQRKGCLGHVMIQTLVDVKEIMLFIGKTTRKINDQLAYTLQQGG